jgi:hypothetical protein
MSSPITSKRSSLHPGPASTLKDDDSADRPTSPLQTTAIKELLKSKRRARSAKEARSSKPPEIENSLIFTVKGEGKRKQDNGKNVRPEQPKPIALHPDYQKQKLKGLFKTPKAEKQNVCVKEGTAQYISLCGLDALSVVIPAQDQILPFVVGVAQISPSTSTKSDSGTWRVQKSHVNKNSYVNTKTEDLGTSSLQNMELQVVLDRHEQEAAAETRNRDPGADFVKEGGSAQCMPKTSSRILQGGVSNRQQQSTVTSRCTPQASSHILQGGISTPQQQSPITSGPTDVPINLVNFVQRETRNMSLFDRIRTVDTLQACKSEKEDVYNHESQLSSGTNKAISVDLEESMRYSSESAHFSVNSTLSSKQKTSPQKIDPKFFGVEALWAISPISRQSNEDGPRPSTSPGSTSQSFFHYENSASNLNQSVTFDTGTNSTSMSISSQLQYPDHVQTFRRIKRGNAGISPPLTPVNGNDAEQMSRSWSPQYSDAQQCITNMNSLSAREKVPFALEKLHHKQYLSERIYEPPPGNHGFSIKSGKTKHGFLGAMRYEHMPRPNQPLHSMQVSMSVPNFHSGGLSEVGCPTLNLSMMTAGENEPGTEIFQPPQYSPYVDSYLSLQKSRQSPSSPSTSSSVIRKKKQESKKKLLDPEAEMDLCAWDTSDTGDLPFS